MRRAGSTLQFLIVKEVLLTNGQVVDHISQELSSKKEFNHDIHNIVKAHRVTPEIRRLLQQPSSRSLYIYRDVRDVLVSEFRLLDIKPSIWAILKNEIVGSVLEDFPIWKSLPNVQISEYSEVMNDLPAEVKKISKHLNVEISDEQIGHISDKLSIRKMKSEQDKKVFNRKKFNRKTMLHSNHINSGESEQWKSHFTESQISILEGISQPWLRDSGFTLHSNSPLKPLYKSMYYFLRKVRNVKNKQL